MSVVESRSVREPVAPSRQSLLALSWVNFFLSGMQTAFGPIAAAYLAIHGWTAKDIGFALTIGSTASLVSQVPGGALVDAVRAKRLLVATGVMTIALGVLIFRLWPSFPLVALAEMLQGMTGGALGPGVVAITLGLVGHARLSERIGLNQRFAAAGGVAVTLSMAVIAYSDSPWAMFVPAALAIPVLVSLNLIRAEEIDFGRASGAEPSDADRPQRASYAALLKNRRLLIFAACAALFQVASASMMPLLGGGLAYEGKRQAAPLIAALIIVPQVLVGLLAPWVGRSAEATAARRVCRSTNPRGALRVDQQSSCLDCRPITGRYHRGRARGDNDGRHCGRDERHRPLQSGPRNVRHRNGGGCRTQSDTYGIGCRSIWPIGGVCEPCGRGARRTSGSRLLPARDKGGALHSKVRRLNR